MIVINENNIEALLEKFFDGNTTNAEDRALEKFFCSGNNVPERYKCYCDMFGWYASGMDSEKLPSASSQPKHVFFRTKTARWWSSVAALIALAAAIAWLSTWQSHTDNTLLYADNYIVRDGHTITGMPEIKADIDASVMDGDCLEHEIDMGIRMLNDKLNEE